MANYLSGEVRLLEHKAILMLHASELFQLDWADADIPIVKEILEREKEKHS
jgi:8-oxo-dGTP diphosphatase